GRRRCLDTGSVTLNGRASSPLGRRAEGPPGSSSSNPRAPSRIWRAIALNGSVRSSDYFFSLAESSTSMAQPLDELRDSLTGDLLVEGDPDFERARLCFNLLIDRRPAAIARCVDRNDVAAALAFGQARSLAIAVRGGGHNPA